MATSTTDMTASKASEPTPMVDTAVEGWSDLIVGPSRLVPASVFAALLKLAKNLERGLQKAEARAAELTERKRPWTPEHTKSVIDGQVKEIDRLTALVQVERERAAEAERNRLHAVDGMAAWKRTAEEKDREWNKLWDQRAGELLARATAAELDAGRLDWYEAQHTLHRSLEVLYVVDGYDLSLMDDDRERWRVHGETLRECIDAALRRSAP